VKKHFLQDLKEGGLNYFENKFDTLVKIDLQEKSPNIWVVLLRKLRRRLDPIDMSVSPDDTLINKVSNDSTDSVE